MADCAPPCAGSQAAPAAIPFRGVHHVGLLVEDLGRSLDFYCGTLGERSTCRIPRPLSMSTSAVRSILLDL